MSNLISWSGSNPTYRSPDSSVAGPGRAPARAAGPSGRGRGPLPSLPRPAPRRASRAGEADSAPLEVLACDAASRRSAAHGIAPGAGRGMPAAVPRVEAGLRGAHRGPGGAHRRCLERLCALQGDASTVTRTALMHGVVARALGTRNVGQLLRSGRGLGEQDAHERGRGFQARPAQGCEGAGSRAPAHCPKPGAQDGRG